MSAVTKFFFRSPYQSQTTWSLLRWWEGRRLTYNAAVGAAGLFSRAIVALVSALPPTPAGFGVPLGAVLIYGILANLFYSFGPLADILVHRWWGRNYSAVGPALFRYGFVFAVGVSLLPIPLALIGWSARLLALLF